MASIYKRGKYFYVAYFDAQGNRRYRSTGCTNKKEANEVAVSWEKAVRKEKKSKVECQSEMADIIARAGREATVGRLTLDKARRYLMEIYRLASGEEFPSYSVSEWLTHWLDESEKRVGEATMRRYHTSVRDVLKVLGSSGEKDIALLTTEDVLRVRDFLRKSGGKASTINYKVQDFKSAIKAAFERGIIDRNVGLSVDALTTEDSDIKAGFRGGPAIDRSRKSRLEGRHSDRCANRATAYKYCRTKMERGRSGETSICAHPGKTKTR